MMGTDREEPMSKKPENLEAWRRRLKKSQREMAHYLGTPVQTYIQWESGRREVPTVAHRLFHVLRGIEREAPKYHRALAEPPPRGKPGRPTGSGKRLEGDGPLPAWMA